MTKFAPNIFSYNIPPCLCRKLYIWQPTFHVWPILIHEEIVSINFNTSKLLHVFVVINDIMTSSICNITFRHSLPIYIYCQYLLIFQTYSLLSSLFLYYDYDINICISSHLTFVQKIIQILSISFLHVCFSIVIYKKSKNKVESRLGGGYALTIVISNKPTMMNS